VAAINRLSPVFRTSQGEQEEVGTALQMFPVFRSRQHRKLVLLVRHGQSSE